MGDRYSKSDDIKNILYLDATNLYGHSISQMLPNDEIKMCHGHPDLYMDKLEGKLNTPDDADIGCFFEVGLHCPDEIIEKKEFPIFF